MKLKVLLILTAVTTPVMIVIMALQGAPLKTTETPLGILDLEFAGKVNRATEVIEAWKPDIIRVAINNTLIDFLFLISYGCFLYACSKSIAKFYKGGWKKFGFSVSVMAIFSAAFDAIENFLMFRILMGTINKELVASTFMFASVKFILAAISVVYILVSLAGLLFKRKNQSHSLLLK